MTNIRTCLSFGLFLFLVCNSIAGPIIPNNHWESVIDDQEFKNIHEMVFEKFIHRFVQVNSQLSKFDPAWPINDAKAALLTRFGTPTILKMKSEKGEENLFYTHEALDITRSSIDVSDEVRSPVAGLAIVVHEEGDNSEYSTTVAIMDEKSKLVVSLLHVNPSAHLSDKDFTRVSQMEIIGNLAKVESMIDPLKQEIYKHTHVSVIDLEKKLLINPNNHFKFYVDKKEPQIHDILLFDDVGKLQKSLVSGKLDIVVNAIDLDGINDINFEIARVSMTVIDDSGKILLNIQDCNLDFLTNQVTRTNQIKDAFYLDYIGNSSNQDFKGGLTNASVQDRRFSYAVTNLKVIGESCSLVEDSIGHIEISDSIQSIKVDVVISDQSGNKSSVTKTIKR